MHSRSLAQASAWLPGAWPHLLQLLSDPHGAVRTAAAALLAFAGCVLAAGWEPRLSGRMPPAALLDWALAVLSPASALPAAQRMSAETKASGRGSCRVLVFSGLGSGHAGGLGWASTREVEACTWLAGVPFVPRSDPVAESPYLLP